MPAEVYQADQQTTTGTAVPDAGGDNHIPTSGSAASWSAITSDSFLPGPQPGQEQVLVKIGNQTAMVAAGERKHDVFKDATTHVTEGDNFHYYHQNRNTDVTKNETLIVHQDREVGVQGKQTVTVIGDQYINVVKTHNVSVVDTINEQANKAINIVAGVELVLQGPGGVIKIDSGGVTIQGVIVKIN
ncbi:MAG: hypothetical protein J2P41_03470 [Blastocatellia bacterium]|nr:hypothetical protein [Blastocatellia bacterium]